MKNKRKKILYTVLIIFIWMILKSTSVKAASASIVANTTTPTQGQTVTVTASVTAGAWNLNFSGAGKSEVIYGFTQTNANSSASKSITFVAGAPGTSYTFSLTGDMTDITSSNSQAVNKSLTITVKASGGNSSSGNTGSNSGNTTPNTPNNSGETNKKSNIATLKNLGIRPNDFKGFNANKLTYSTTVPYETETIEVYASKGHDKQTITGTGSKKLNMGLNKVDITVTAEDGTTKKTYTINITRKEKGDTSEDKEEEEPEEDSVQDTVFGLSELIIEGINLEPEFQTDIYEYNIELKEDIDKLDFSTLLATSVGAEIEIIGNENLQEGENIITIIIKGENEEETVTYQIIVNKIVPKENTEIVEENNEQRKKMIIIGCTIVGAMLIIIIIIIIIIKKKNSIKEKEDEGFMKYNHINDIYKESFQNSLEDEEDYDGNNKRNKGKRYK
ncbi:MAG: cadherin-like beta sandwich domain-containing protein [Clostridia bacterium]|nr:cadherin-like beta sandwich domain-containing protein [Clostridia bacterium]